VDASQLRDYLRTDIGLRIEGETAAYLHRKLQDAAEVKLALMGGDARTGIAVRRELMLDSLRGAIRE
jgi:hypothetical protein